MKTSKTPHSITGRKLWAAAAVAALSMGAAAPATAQTIGGHIGFVLPLVTEGGGQTTTLADGFSMGFPFGITLKGKGPFALDFEFIPQIQDSPRNVSFTVHPGALWSIGHGFAVGLRAAFVVNSPEFGFTPLLHKSWPIQGEHNFFKAYFAEADLPVRFDRPPGGLASNPVTFAMHFGLEF